MIPRSTTIGAAGRALRARLRWAVAAVVLLLILTWVALLLDRSTVVDGPSGSTFVTTATGVAAIHDVLDRVGRAPVQLRRPVTSASLEDIETFTVIDVGFGGYEPAERLALVEHVRRGGRIVILGQPPERLLTEFGLSADWIGNPVGVIDVAGFDDVETVAAERFGSFAPGHGGRVLAGSVDRDLAVEFVVGSGEILLVADSSIAHNATVDRADNVDFLGAILTGGVGFDEFRHGYDDTPTVGLIAAAPGNWEGALALGAVALALGLVAYGRRFGPVEPTARDLAPDRTVFIDSVARSMRRTGDDIPAHVLRTRVTRELRLSPDADLNDVVAAAIADGADPRRLEDLPDGSAAALDRVLAAVLERKAR